MVPTPIDKLLEDVPTDEMWENILHDIFQDGDIGGQQVQVPALDWVYLGGGKVTFDESTGKGTIELDVRYGIAVVDKDPDDIDIKHKLSDAEYDAIRTEMSDSAERMIEWSSNNASWEDDHWTFQTSDTVTLPLNEEDYEMPPLNAEIAERCTKAVEDHIEAPGGELELFIAEMARLEAALDADAKSIEKRLNTPSSRLTFFEESENDEFHMFVPGMEPVDKILKSFEAAIFDILYDREVGTMTEPVIFAHVDEDSYDEEDYLQSFASTDNSVMPLYNTVAYLHVAEMHPEDKEEYFGLNEGEDIEAAAKRIATAHYEQAVYDVTR